MADFLAELRAGWRNLAAAMLGLAFGVPGYTAISSLFFHALVAEFHWSRAAAAGALVALPVVGALLPFVGIAIDRFGVRSVVFLSTCGASVSYLWLARIGNDLPAYYAGFLALNLLGCGTGPIAYTRIVAASFERSRGTALAVAQIGVAVAAIAFPPVIGAVIATSGWRGAYGMLAVVTAIAGVVAIGLMRPQARALGKRASRTQGLLAMPAFWILAGTLLAISAGAIGLVSQLQSILVERGFELRSAAATLSLLGVSVLVSRLLTGVALDRLNPGRTAALVLVIAALGSALLASGTTQPAGILIGIALFGVSIGAELDLMSYFCARLFGLEHYSANYGALSVFFYTGMSAGAVGYGAARDVTGNYDAAIWMTAAALLLAAAGFLRIGSMTPRRRPAAATG